MVYIKSKRNYDTKIVVGTGSKAKTFIFECERYYNDTGNIAQTGVTAIDDGDFEMLKKNCVQFKNLMKLGQLCKTDTDGALAVANEIDTLKEENDKLKEELKVKTEEAANATSAETESLKNENEALKKQIEEMIKAEKANPLGDVAAETADEKPAEPKSGKKGTGEF